MPHSTVGRAAISAGSTNLGRRIAIDTPNLCRPIFVEVLCGLPQSQTIGCGLRSTKTCDKDESTKIGDEDYPFRRAHRIYASLSKFRGRIRKTSCQREETSLGRLSSSPDSSIARERAARAH